MARKKIPRNNCKCCKKELNRPEKLYCNNKCQWKHIRLERFEKGTLNCATLKKHVLETKGHFCEVCKNEHWMSCKIPLILDHIDGDSNNNKIQNLRLVCGNCDMQLPTYKSKNKGKGRIFRRERYAKGLSY